jgi:hypothetical protein
MSGMPADPWRSPDGDPLLDLVSEGGLILDQIAELLKGGPNGANDARLAVKTLSRLDLEEAVFYCAVALLAERGAARQADAKRRRRRPLPGRPRWWRGNRPRRRRRRD